MPYSNTLARKFKSSVLKVRRKYAVKDNFGIRFKHKEKERYEIWDNFSWDKVKKKRSYKKLSDSIPNPNIYKGRTSLTERLAAIWCENCGIENTKLEIHHCKTIRNKNWLSIRNKETKVLCQQCHRKITNQQLSSFKI